MGDNIAWWYIFKELGEMAQMMILHLIQIQMGNYNCNGRIVILSMKICEWCSLSSIHKFNSCRKSAISLLESKFVFVSSARDTATGVKRLAMRLTTWGRNIGFCNGLRMACHCSPSLQYSKLSFLFGPLWRQITNFSLKKYFVITTKNKTMHFGPIVCFWGDKGTSHFYLPIHALGNDENMISMVCTKSTLYMLSLVLLAGLE